MEVERLFDEHCGFVWRSLRHLGVDEAALDDAAQDVFVTAHRRWSTFEGRSNERTWLFGIARRIAHRYRRSARTRLRRFVSGEKEVVDDPVARVHGALSLAAMIARLDRDKRAVFVLAEIEGMTAPEVSQALGIPLGTAYSRLRAAWQLLGRAAVQDERRAELGRLRVEPSDASRRRMWTAIAAGLTPARTVAILGQLKWLAAGGVLGASLVGVGAAALPTPSEAAPVVAVEEDTAPSPPVADPPPRSAAVVAPEPVAAPPASPPPPPSRRTTRSAAPPAPDLAEELRLVRGAKAAITDARADAALAMLDEHARRFPDGQLTAERRSTRIAALCLAGRPRDAAIEARALGRTPPC